MSNQVEPGTIGAAPEQGKFGAAAPEPGESGAGQQLAGLNQESGSPWAPSRPYHGRAVSWVAVSLIMVAFLVGGLALVFGPTWWLFWVSLGIAVVGGLLALATNIFEDWY
jgi:hypothetical protein